MRSLWIVFALAMVMFVGCNNEIENAEEPMQGEEVTVKIGFDGEVLDITEGPLETKASGNDLYGVQVYCLSPNIADYEYYAYGLFDDPSKMEINLLTGYKYRFEATMIENGKDVIHSSYNYDLKENSYMDPFCHPLKNLFIYSNNKYIPARNSYSAVNTDDTYLFLNRPNIIRYYGVLNDYKPVLSLNDNINIYLYKVFFGAKFFFNNFDEGNITIKIPEAPVMTVTYPNNTVEDIFTFGNFYNFGEESIVMEEILNVFINWTRNDGVTIPVYNGPIKFTRNKQTIVTVNLDQESESLGTKVEIDLEDTPMAPGEEVTINP